LKVLEDARRFGMDEQSLANLREAMVAPAVTDDQTGVWPENWDIVLAFLSVDTQWRIATIGGGGFAPALPVYVGLDYAAVRAGLEAEEIVITPELWRGLRVMEAEACTALNEGNR
jgi:hypothetical protein